MYLLRLSILPLMLALFAGCRSSEPPAVSATGSVSLVASTGQALAVSDIARVTVTTSAADMPTITIELAQIDGAWGGVIGDIPSGTNRTFLAQAYDSTGTLRYEGRVENVTVRAGVLTLVTLTLQNVSPSTPFTNEAPIIDSVTATPLVVAPGASVTLVASAHDPNPGDTLTYSWTAASGSFSAPSKPSTNWTAPATTGPVSLRLTVSDSRGAASLVTLMVRVSAGEGGAVVDVSFNNPPKVISLTSSQSYLDVGQQTTLSTSVSDADGDSLSYTWSATCAGTFEGADTSTARFTPTALPTATCNNCQVSVAVSDGRGGQTTGTVTLCISKDVAKHLPPTIVRSYQSTLTANPGQQVTFEVVASDPENSSINFTWSASTGSLGVAETTTSTSRLTWAAPACINPGTTPSIVATATNSFSLSVSRTFAVSNLPTCLPSANTWTHTTPMLSRRRNHYATLLPSGKVLFVGGYTRPDDSSSVDNTAPSELYDPVTGTWTALTSRAKAGDGFAAVTLPSKKILIVGGFPILGSPLSTAELYDPDSDSYSSITMSSTRLYPTATLLQSGKVLVAGGDWYYGGHKIPEVYDPITGTWTPTGPMSSARTHPSAVLLKSGKVLISGGENSDGEKLSTAEIYNPAEGTWTLAAPMLSAHVGHTLTLLPSGKVLLVGTVSNGTGGAELYDPETNIWTNADSGIIGFGYHTSTLLPSGRVLAIGGSNSAGIYNPLTNSWMPTGPEVTHTRYLHSATLLPSGQVLVAGGGDSSMYAHPVITADIYTP
ncbi:hypothetical protein CYFUS_007693 [Cystobacter fuscus]|uniref:High-affinity leucine-specific transport system, periplasmic binding protein LivK n=1 Tax=Cystobacter fuscus TaxID=43 RepID=A0A250JGE6_9BACT|nr:kelch repeat-containing protein [Cystobacter fuscus]ATB42216.1 hypothetical protein CYFUS_007693 [Cystobacter fuscus]